jgi:L-ascorbate metabolism protein UlaG (beta-lactamase superfamily)
MTIPFETDVISTSAGNVAITFLGHGSLMMEFKGMIIYVDPFSEVADYSQLPKADIVLITHEHGDHLDLDALGHVRTKETVIALTELCAAQVEGGIIIRNGETREVGGLTVNAVPAYNIVNKRPDGLPFHPKGAGNGYIVTFGDTRIYIAGDTENTSEMKNLQNISIAFLPMNLPYTMTPEMVSDAVRAFRPRILYPYHFGETDTSRIVDLLKGEDVEVRIRKMA